MREKTEDRVGEALDYEKVRLDVVIKFFFKKVPRYWCEKFKLNAGSV